MVPDSLYGGAQFLTRAPMLLSMRRIRRTEPIGGVPNLKQPGGATRRDRLAMFAAGVVGVAVAVEAALIAVLVIGPDSVWDFGMDYRYYRDVGVRWLADGTYYLPIQLAGPYDIALLGIVAPDAVVTLYPPSALLLFVPLAVLPAIAWWTIPMTVTGYALYRLRPAPWAWVVMLVMLAFPRAVGAYLFGNTDMWMAAAVAAGLVWGWPALTLTMKPSFAPLALIGMRRGSWWIAAVLGGVSVLAMLPLWADYLVSLRNARGLDTGYSLGSLPLVLAPIVAWVARAQTAAATSEGRTAAAPSS